MIVIIVLPVVTPKEFINTKAFALSEFTNRELIMRLLLAGDLKGNYYTSQWLAKRFCLHSQLSSAPLDHL
jgi:hypothetical protein